MTFVSAFGSSVYSAGIFAVKDEFGVSEEVALLGITLYVVGFAVGRFCYELSWCRMLTDDRTTNLGTLVRNFGEKIAAFHGIRAICSNERCRGRWAEHSDCASVPVLRRYDLLKLQVRWC